MGSESPFFKCGYRLRDAAWRGWPCARWSRRGGAAGLLYAEGLIDGPDDLHEVREVPNPDRPLDNRVEVRLRHGLGLDASANARSFIASSACGVCGKAAIDSVFSGTSAPLPRGPIVDGALLASLPAAMRPEQRVFRRTGSIHAAGVFTSTGELLTVREDVGRHNAVDKVVGDRLLRNAMPFGESILVVSGRIGFEIAQKALRAGLPILVAVGAPSDLALRTADRGGMTVVGFARDGRCNVYTGRERVHWT